MGAQIVGTPVAAPSNTDTVSYTAESGSDRLLIYVFIGEVLYGNDATAVTYGGVALTGTVSSLSTETSKVQIWTLKEADIPAGANDFVVTRSSATATSWNYGGVIYTVSGASQTSPIASSGAGSVASDTNGPTITFNSVASSVVIAGLMHSSGNNSLSLTNTNTASTLTYAIDAEVTNADAAIYGISSATTAAASETLAVKFGGGYSGSSAVAAIAVQPSDTIPRLQATFVADENETAAPASETYDYSIHDATTRALIGSAGTTTVVNGAFDVEESGLSYSTEYLVLPIRADKVKGKPFFATTQAEG